MDNNNSLKYMSPPVVLDEGYIDRLQDLAESTRIKFPMVAERLLYEIDRADIRSSEDIENTIINFGSQVTYRDETDKTIKKICIGWPGEANIEQGWVSVLTPIGAALIGLSQGAVIDWKTNTGEIRKLTVLTVEKTKK